MQKQHSKCDYSAGMIPSFAVLVVFWFLFSCFEILQQKRRQSFWYRFLETVFFSANLRLQFWYSFLSLPSYFFKCTTQFKIQYENTLLFDPLVLFVLTSLMEEMVLWGNFPSIINPYPFFNCCVLCHYSSDISVTLLIKSRTFWTECRCADTQHFAIMIRTEQLVPQTAMTHIYPWRQK